MKIGPVLEATTNYHQGKPGIELELSPYLENFQSWARISNGLNKFVKNLTEKLRIPDEEETTRESYHILTRKRTNPARGQN